MRLPKLHHPFQSFVLSATALFLCLHLWCLVVAWRHRDGVILNPVDWGASGSSQVVIQSGERIVSANGDPGAARLGPIHVLRALHAGDDFTLALDGGQGVRITHTTLQRRPADPRRQVLLFLASLYSLAASTVFALVRPAQRWARGSYPLGLMGCCVWLGMFLFHYWFSVTGPSAWLATALASVSPLHLAGCFHFASYLPPGAPDVARNRVFRIVLYVFALALNLPRTIWDLAVEAHTTLTRQELLGTWTVSFFDANYEALKIGFYLLLGVATVVTLVGNYRREPSVTERYRIRWITGAALMALLPGILYRVGKSVLIAVGLGGVTTTPAFEFLGDMVIFIAVASPLAALYGILRYGAFGIRFVVRRGVQYLFMKNVLRGLLLAPVFFIAWQMLAHPDRSLRSFFTETPLPLLVLVTFTAGLSLRYRKHLIDWVDRKFFRGGYSQEHLMIELIDRLKEADSITEISQLVTHQLDAALHPKRIYLFFRREDTSGWTLGYPNDDEAEKVLRWIERRDLLSSIQTAATRPIEVPDDPADSVEGRAHGTLIVPLCDSSDRVFGVMWLDGKKSEEPYSDRDRALIKGIAGQIALSFENLHLKERVEEELRVKHEVLGRLSAKDIRLLKECPACHRCYDATGEFCPEDSTRLTMTLPVERILDRKYRLERRLGQGGMGAVYHATDLRLNRPVAVKVMTGRLFGNQAAMKRFEREARASARLQHPNIVTIYDYGKLAGEGAYLVMELLEGRSWRAEVEARQPVPPQVLAEWCDQLCRGMMAAHALGIIHRDLKPENIMIMPRLGARDLVKILDFGLAKSYSSHATESVTQATSAGVIVGTLRYMSPEQMTAHGVDGRSDIYSFGILLIETIFGVPPANNAAMMQWLEGLNSSLEQMYPGWEPRDLTGKLARMVERDRALRFESVEQMADALIPALRRCPEGLQRPAAMQEVIHTKTMGA